MKSHASFFVGVAKNFGNTENYWKPQVEFNEWFKKFHDKVSPKIELIDTTHLSVEKTEVMVKDWIEGKVKINSFKS